MKERNFDDMIAYFNRRVSEMDIAQDYKMELLGMVTALGYKHEKTAQPERMRGRWIEIQAPDSDGGNALYECSVCHRGEAHVPIVEVPFCWHCGAQMTEGEG